MTLDYKNISVHYTVKGEGTPVVLLHGFLEDLSMWEDLIPELSKKNEVICIDLLGHGKTGCLGYIHTMEDMADAVATILNNLYITKATFIGHSMGGYVALALANKYPSLCDALCLMNSTFEADNKDRQDLRSRAIKMAQANYNSLVRMSFSNLFAPKSRDTFKKKYNDALQLALQTPVQGYIAAQEGMKIRMNLLEVLRTLKGKKLIIVGKKDTLINIDNIKSQIKNTKIEIIELSEGHMSHIENKSELSYTINHFIEK